MIASSAAAAPMVWPMVALMEFTGIYRMPASCLLEEVGLFEASRDRLFREWAEEGLQAVNTTFLSDLDY